MWHVCTLLVSKQLCLGITLLFVYLPVDYQWGIVSLLTIILEINIYLLQTICFKSAGITNNEIKLTCTHEMECRHVVYLSVALTLIVTISTAYFCLLLGFFGNLFKCLKIIWRIKKQNEIVDFENDVNILALVLKEKVDYIVPLTYTICLVVAYLGPNAWIIGNVYNESWHFGRLEDFFETVKIMGIFFALDFISIVVWSILLKLFCRISYYHSLLSMQKKYWLFMAIHEAFSLNEVTPLGKNG